LAKIAGKEMLLRVVDIAKKGTKNTDAEIVVATEDERIENFCKAHDVKCLMTSDACKTGSDRVCEAVKKMGIKPELVVNLQGDNPVCPPWFVEELIKAFEEEGILSPAMKKKMQASAEKGEVVPEGIEAPVNAYGAKTNSALYLVRLCDIYAQKKLDNAPGTIDEYANWRLKLSHTIERIRETPEFVNTLAAIKKHRP
jgi:CMP-2-keto-3-deoxyoctulosonic acid synthetase